VRTALQARRSVVWAMVIIGGFYLLTLFLGFGAAHLVGPATIAGVDAGGNMAGPLLAQYIGGGPDSFFGNFMLAFVSAVAFATIVAVVAGLVLASASAMAHDLFVGVIRAGKETTPRGQVLAARVATLIVGAMSIGIGIAAKGQNVAVLVGLAFAVAASANFPCVLLTLYWKRCNTGGIVAGMLIGTIAAVGLTLVSPNLTYPKAVKAAAHKVLEAAPAKHAAAEEASRSPDAAIAAKAAKTLADLDKATAKANADLQKWANDDTSFMGLEKPLFELKNPGLISIPLGFLGVILGSLFLRDRRAEAMWNEVYARQNTGLLVSKSAAA
jgi:cation/acetate symporter